AIAESDVEKASQETIDETVQETTEETTAETTEPSVESAVEPTTDEEAEASEKVEAETPVEGEPGPYGPGSAAANDDGSGPDGWSIKGNAGSMLYHPEDSPYFSRTKAEVWFRDEESAQAAGFQRWDHKRTESSEEE
ncbi:MAG: hypothetical protein WB239_06980, partial [Acidimicrobiia bacterium]